MCKAWIFFLSIYSLHAIPPEFLKAPSPWADAVLASMSRKDKVAHLFFMNIPMNSSDEDLKNFKKFIQHYPIGGIYLGDMQGAKTTIKRQIEIVNLLQQASTYPLLVCQDLEFGLPMRLLEGPRTLTAQTLGTLPDTLVYENARMLARHAQAVGVRMTATPVADINFEEENPIIGFRAFGTNSESVTRCAVLHAKGLTDERSLSCGKHFPGHGRTKIDSHLTLPSINENRKILEQTDLKPFQALIDNGVAIIMVGHLVIPALDPHNLPATISSRIIKQLLREQMGFEGLIMSDAMTMNALGTIHPVEANIAALKAGIDVIIFPQNIEESIAAVIKALDHGELSEDMITKSVHKILKAKEWLHLDKNKYTQPTTLEKIDTVSDVRLRNRMYKHSFSIINNLVVPLDLTQYKCLNNAETPVFIEALQKQGIKIVNEITKDDKTIIVPLVTSLRGIYNQDIKKQLHEHCIVALFGNPRALKSLPQLPGFFIDNNSNEAQLCAARLVMLSITKGDGNSHATL